MFAFLLLKFLWTPCQLVKSIAFEAFLMLKAIMLYMSTSQVISSMFFFSSVTVYYVHFLSFYIDTACLNSLIQGTIVQFLFHLFLPYSYWLVYS